MRQALLVGVALVLLGCGARTTPGTRGAHPLAAVSGELEQVTPSSTAASAVLSFHNASTRTVRVLRYRVHWLGGQVVVRSNLTVPAGVTLEAPLDIGPEAGDLDVLYKSPMGARVEILKVAEI